MPPSKTVLSSGKLSGGPKLTVDFIDVGQGNCVLVSYPNGGFMLADCGSQATSTSGKPFKHAQQYVTSVTGGEDIACVVLSHGDDDHTAFAPHIAEAQNPTYVHYGGSIGDYSGDVQAWISSMENTRGRFVYRYPKGGYGNSDPDADFGTDTDPGDAHVMVLSANQGKGTNGRSIVLMLRFGKRRIVLPGDAEWDTENRILTDIAKKIWSRVSVLMPGHHGAYTSTGNGWAKKLDPDVAVISASGSNMSYAHPDCETNALLMDYVVGGAEAHDVICSEGKGKAYKRSSVTDALFVTATNGDVRYVTDGTNYKVMVSSLARATLFDAVPAAPRPKSVFRLVGNAPAPRLRVPGMRMVGGGRTPGRIAPLGPAALRALAAREEEAPDEEEGVPAEA